MLSVETTFWVQPLFFVGIPCMYLILSLIGIKYILRKKKREVSFSKIITIIYRLFQIIYSVYVIYYLSGVIQIRDSGTPGWYEHSMKYFFNNLSEIPLLTKEIDWNSHLQSMTNKTAYMINSVSNSTNIIKSINVTHIIDSVTTDTITYPIKWMISNVYNWQSCIYLNADGTFIFDLTFLYNYFEGHNRSKYIWIIDSFGLNHVGYDESIKWGLFVHYMFKYINLTRTFWTILMENFDHTFIHHIYYNSVTIIFLGAILRSDVSTSYAYPFLIDSLMNIAINLNFLMFDLKLKNNSQKYIVILLILHFITHVTHTLFAVTFTKNNDIFMFGLLRLIFWTIFILLGLKVTKMTTTVNTSTETENIDTISPLTNLSKESANLSTNPLTVESTNLSTNPLTVESTNLSTNPLTVESTNLSNNPLTLESTNLSNNPLTVESTNLSNNPLTVESTNLSNNPLTLESTNLSNNPLTLESTNPLTVESTNPLTVESTNPLTNNICT
jgi:hypothetical protein